MADALGKPENKIALPDASDSEAEGGSTAQHTVSRVTCPHAVAGRVSPGAGGLQGLASEPSPRFPLAAFRPGTPYPRAVGRPAERAGGQTPALRAASLRVLSGPCSQEQETGQAPGSPASPTTAAWRPSSAWVSLVGPGVLERSTWWPIPGHALIPGLQEGRRALPGSLGPSPGRDCSPEGSWDRRPALGSRITMLGRTRFTALGCRAGLLLRPLPAGTGKSEPIWSTHLPRSLMRWLSAGRISPWFLYLGPKYTRSASPVLPSPAGGGKRVWEGRMTGVYFPTHPTWWSCDLWGTPHDAWGP